MNVLPSCLDQGKISLSGKGNVPTSPPRTRILVYQINLLQQPQVISYSLFQQKLPPKIMLQVYFNFSKVYFHDFLKNNLWNILFKKIIKIQKRQFIITIRRKTERFSFLWRINANIKHLPLLFRILLSYIYSELIMIMQSTKPMMQFYYEYVLWWVSYLCSY